MLKVSEEMRKVLFSLGMSTCLLIGCAPEESQLEIKEDVQLEKEEPVEEQELYNLKHIEELFRNGETDEVIRLIDAGKVNKYVDVNAVRSYLEFLNSTEPVSLKAGKLMDEIEYGYSGVLSTEIKEAIYLPHEPDSIITFVFQDRKGYDELNWKYNEGNAYRDAREFQELNARVEVEKYQKEKLIEAAKGQNSHIGMTKEEVEASLWGKPERINRTVTAYGTREQWVYGNRQYLYFTDGILTSFQDQQ